MADTIYTKLVAVWMDEYEKLRGFKPTSFGAKEGKCLKEIIRKMELIGKIRKAPLTDANCEATMRRFIELAQKNSWYVENWSLSILNSRFDDIVAKGNKATKSDMKRYKESLRDDD